MRSLVATATTFLFRGRFDIDTIEDIEDRDAIRLVGLAAGTLESVIASASAAGADTDGLYNYDFDGGTIRVAVLLTVGDFDLSWRDSGSARDAARGRPDQPPPRRLFFFAAGDLGGSRSEDVVGLAPDATAARCAR